MTKLDPALREAILSAIPNLRAFAISLSGNVDYADDLVQETLLRGLVNIDRFDPDQSVPTWLSKILRDIFYTQYRERRSASAPSASQQPPEQNERVEFRQYREALANLKPAHREALTLVGSSGFSYEEAAQIVGVSARTIRSRVGRARAKLAEFMAVETVDDLDPSIRAALHTQPETPSHRRNAQRLRPPRKQLPPPGPATQFAYIRDRFDIVPSTDWRSSATRASQYHSRAQTLIASLTNRIANADDNLYVSLSALKILLGTGVKELHEDQVHLAWLQIDAKARAYGHQSARWEIAVESVSELFELASILHALLQFVPARTKARARAIRSLPLSADTIVGSKNVLDLISEGIVGNSPIVSTRVEDAIGSLRAISNAAGDLNVQIEMQGSRILFTGNLGLAIANQLKSEDKQGSTEPAKTSAQVGADPVLQPKHSEEVKPKDAAWPDFCVRVIHRIKLKGPDEIGDELIKAIIFYGKTVVGLALVFIAWSILDPALFGGTLGTIIAWILFELRRRNIL